MANNNNQHERNRRDVLGLIGTTAAAFGIGLQSIDVVQAGSHDYHAGESVFIETKIEHPDISAGARSEGSQRLSYIVDEENHRVMLNDAPSNLAQSPIIATNGDEFTTQGEVLPAHNSRWSVVSQTDYRRHELQLIPLASPQQSPELQLKLDAQEAMVSIGETVTNVPPETEESVILPARDIPIHKRLPESERTKHKSMEEVTIESEPVVKIKNHGELSIISGEGVRVLPLNSDDVYSKSRVRSHLEVGAERVLEQGHNGLLIVEDRTPDLSNEETNDGGEAT